MFSRSKETETVSIILVEACVHHMSRQNWEGFYILVSSLKTRILDY